MGMDRKRPFENAMNCGSDYERGSSVAAFDFAPLNVLKIEAARARAIPVDRRWRQLHWKSNLHFSSWSDCLRRS
jgi:hypothetical protein